MTARLAQLELHLPGLLKLLGEHLYSDRRVAFRELVQNAHDSCVRRRLEDPSAPESRVSIRLEERDGRAWVCFDDNGLGLTDGEIERFLSTIGRGQTGAIKQELGAARTEELVGQFGVGLLSAFLIGDRVVVTTRRVGEPQGWQWICDGQQTYRLEEKDVASEGTSVAVRLRDDARDLASPARVREAVRHYAGWLETPIAIDGSPLSTRALPWSDQLSRITPLELATSLCDDRPPLAVVELAPFEDPELGTVPLHGLLAIPEGSQLSVREYGRATVLIRRMLVDPRAEGLLPRWARFVTGMIDCARLEPTASRETVRHERVFAAVRDAIEVQLTEALQRIADEEPQRWQRIIDAHAALLKRWALDSAVLFDAIADRVTFRTSRGNLTLPAYLKASSGTIYYFAHEDQARAMALLLESARRPVIDAQWFAEAPFLKCYAEVRGVPIVEEANQPGAGLLERVRPSAAEQRLLDELREEDLEVVAARFAPVEVPALVITPRRMRLAKEAAQEATETAPRDPMATLLGDYAKRAPALKRVLHVNLDNPFVQQLVLRESAPRLPALAILKAMARLLGGDRLEPHELIASAQTATTALGDLLGAPPPRPETRPLHASWLEAEAGLAPLKARLVAERCRTFEALAAANAKDLAAAVDLPPVVVEALIRLASSVDAEGASG